MANYPYPSAMPQPTSGPAATRPSTAPPGSLFFATDTNQWSVYDSALGWLNSAGGAGGVTSVSSANGNITVANPTTTPALTLVLDSTAGDIAALGVQAAGAVGKPADAGHVHPTTGVVTTSTSAGGDLTGTYPNPTITSTANFKTQVETVRLDQMAAPTASVSLNSQKITSLANGSASTDAATFGQIPTFYFAANNTGGTTTSTTYTNSLTTAGATPSVSATVKASGVLKITIAAFLNFTSTCTASATFALSGANTLAAADGNGGGGPMVSQAISTASLAITTTAVFYVTGLTTGATTVQIYWKQASGTANINNQTLLVEAY